MGKSHDLATLKDDGLTIKNRLEVNHSTNAASAFPSGNWAAKIYNQHDTSTEGGLVVGNRYAAGTSTALLVGGLYDAGDGFDEYLKVDGVGRVTMPYQPSFKAHISGGSITVASNNGNSAIFSSTDHNVGGHYSTSTGRFTAPIAGRYVFTCSIFKYTTYNNPDNTYWGFSKNGTMILTTNHGANGYDGGQCISIVAQLAVGDYVDVRCTSGGPIISYGMPYNSFSGHLLG